MNKKQLIAACVFIILITTVYRGNVYSENKTNNTNKSFPEGSFIDKILYKRVVLPGWERRVILVNRLTGEVKYILVNNNQWMLLTGTWKIQYQAKYNAKLSSKK